MKRSVLLIILSLILSAPAARAQSTSQTAPTPICKEGRVCVEAVQFESKLVGAQLPYNVVLPADYKRGSSKQKRYPVVYLLHGLKGSANDWVSERAHIAAYAAQYSFIIVTPEGRDGWYTDSASVPNEKFESYFVEELIPDVDRRFRTIASREARAVAGLSMGGYGSLKFGLKFPQLFAFAASMSGALYAASYPNGEPTPGWVRPSIERAYGAIDSATRRDNDIFRIARELPAARVASLPFFYLDCGTEDPLVFNDNRDFSALLIQKKIPHEFRQLPGTHSWPYWDTQVQEILKIAARKLSPARVEKTANAR